MAGADLVTSLRQAGVNRGDLVALVISRAGLGLAAADRAWTVAAGGACGRGRAGRRGAAAPLGALVGPDGGAAGRGRGAAGYVLGHRRGAPAAVRRLAGRPRLGLGPAARPGHRHDAGRRAARPVRHGRGRRQRPGGAGRAPAPRVGQRRLVGQPRADGTVGRPGPDLAGQQQAALAALDDRPMALPTARSESTAELLCAELSADGLPMDRAVAEQVLTSLIGPRPRSEADAAAQRAARDAEVLRHAPAGVTADLRSPAQVKSLLARMGVDVPDTRASRLREMRDAHPLIGALLDWRKAERIATTYGYAWLDAHLGADGRLRGAWTGSDGAAGRMTASAGLHNMPAALRPAVIAADGHVFVRADLGQIEPRVLAAVSGDRALVAAARSDDLYAPVAAQLGVERAVAKVAVLGAMYGQTTGHGAQALRRLNAAYPVAMAYLDSADRAGRAGRDLRTYGGRLIQLTPPRRTAERQPGRGLRPVRAQRDDPGRGGGAVQGVGGHRPGPVRAARRPDRAVPARRAARARPVRAGGAGVPAGRRVPAGSRAALGARLRGPLHLRHHGSSAAGRTPRARPSTRRAPSGRACPRAATRRSWSGGQPGLAPAAATTAAANSPGASSGEKWPAPSSQVRRRRRRNRRSGRTIRGGTAGRIPATARW